MGPQSCLPLAPWVPKDPLSHSFLYQHDCVKNKRAYEHTQVDIVRCHRGSTCVSCDNRISQGQRGSCMFYRAGLTPFVMHGRCQHSNPVVHLRWPSLGEFVPTVGLPDGSRPGCWSWLCRPTFYGMPASPSEPSSMEISSSSHYSWRHLLFKPPPLISAASWELLVFRVLLIVL